MANDASLAVRRAIITALRGDAALTALLPASAIHSERAPSGATRPFTRYGVSDTSPDIADCLDGCVIDVPIHVFGNGPSTDETKRIAARIAKVLDGASPIGDGDVALDISWTGTRILPDVDEADHWHGVVSFEVEAAAE